MKTKHALSLIVVFLLGCLAMPQHVAPSSGPRATIVLGSTQGLGFGYTYKSCDGAGLAEAGLAHKEFVVKGDQEVTLVVGTGFSRTCNIVFGFNAAADKTYLVNFTKEQNKCFVGVYEDGTEPPKPVPVRELAVGDLGHCVKPGSVVAQ